MPKGREELIPLYNTREFALDTVRAAPGLEISIPGDKIAASTDGTLTGLVIRLDFPTNDPIKLDRFNPIVYMEGFRRFYLETTAQAGRTLHMFIGREAGADAWTERTYMAAHTVFYTVRSDKDSTPSYTPLIVKDKEGFIDVMPISELSDFQDKISHNGAELSRVEGLKVYNSSKGWADIKYVSRHHYEGNIVCFGTARGHVHTTPNHSVVNHAGIVDAADLRRGDSVSCSIIHGTNGTVPKSGGARSPFFAGTEELAWLYGLFAAEGSVQRNGERGHVSLIYNKDKSLLEKAETIAQANLNAKTKVHKSPSAVVYHLSMYGTNLANFLRESFYTKEKEKRVPKAILNSPPNIKKAFLEGYWAGDGCRGKYGRLDVETCTSVSQTLAQGVLWLLTSTNKRTYHLVTSHGKNPKTTDIWVNQTSDWHDPRLKKNRKVTSVRQTSYKGYVYDIETESHTFLAGVGGIRLHNTHFAGALAQYEKEDENLTGLLYNKIRILGMVLQSDQQLWYKVLFWKKDTFDDTDLDTDMFCGETDINLSTDGFQIGGAGQWYLDVRDMAIDCEDEDKTLELHISLMNMSGTAKTAGAAGEVSLEIYYEPRV